MGVVVTQTQPNAYDRPPQTDNSHILVWLDAQATTDIAIGHLLCPNTTINDHSTYIFVVPTIVSIFYSMNANIMSHGSRNSDYIHDTHLNVHMTMLVQQNHLYWELSRFVVANRQLPMLPNFILIIFSNSSGIKPSLT